VYDLIRRLIARRDTLVMVRLSRNDVDTAIGVEGAGDTSTPVKNGEVIDDTGYWRSVVDDGMELTGTVGGRCRTWTTPARRAATAEQCCGLSCMMCPVSRRMRTAGHVISIPTRGNVTKVGR